jgi:hypothetical protein
MNFENNAGAWCFRVLSAAVSTLEGAVFVAMGANVMKDGDVSTQTHAGIGALAGISASLLSACFLDRKTPLSLLFPLIPMLGTTALSAYAVGGKALVFHGMEDFAVGAAIGLPTIVAPIVGLLWCCKESIPYIAQHYESV